MRRILPLLIVPLFLAACSSDVGNPADVQSETTPYTTPDSTVESPQDLTIQPEGPAPVSNPLKRLLTRRGAHSYLYFPAPGDSVMETGTVKGPGLFWRQYSDVVAHLGVFSPLLSSLFDFRSLDACTFEKYAWQPSHVVRNYACGLLRVIETTAFAGENSLAVRVRVQNDGAATAFALRGHPGTAGLAATVVTDGTLPGARMTLSGKLVNLWSDPVPTTWHVAVTSAPAATSSEVVEDGTSWSLNFALGEKEVIDVVLTVEVGEGNTPTPAAVLPEAFYGLVAAIDDEIEAWFEQAPDPVAAGTTATYAMSWYLFWENASSARGNWNRVAITPSKRSYFRGVWLWDAAFNAMALSLGDIEARTQAAAQLELFLTHPYPDGHLPREIWTNDMNPGVQPPGVLTWAVSMLEEESVDNEVPLGLMATYFDVLKANHAWFIANTDSDMDGLYEWSGTDSGWDTSPRWDQGPVEALDLMCWLYLDATLLSSAAQKLARLEDAVLLSDEAALLKERIQTLFWDANTNFFYDLTVSDNTPTMVQSPATYLPLLVGAATPEQAQAVAAHLSAAGIFASPYILPSVAVSSPAYDSDNYWRGPVWIILNALTIWGLENYGLTDAADALRTHTFSLLAGAPTTYEYYDSQTGEGLGAPDFMWSGAFYILLRDGLSLPW